MQNRKEKTKSGSYTPQTSTHLLSKDNQRLKRLVLEMLQWEAEDYSIVLADLLNAALNSNDAKAWNLERKKTLIYFADLITEQYDQLEVFRTALMREFAGR